MHLLAAVLEHSCQGMLREPVDLEIWPQGAQLLRDCDVAQGVAEADRRREVQRARLARSGPGPTAVDLRRSNLVHEIAQQQVEAHGFARVRQVAGPFEDEQIATERGREAFT